MGFFKDILTGGYKLHAKVVPKEIRKWEPKELQPGGLNLALGIDVDGSLAKARRNKIQTAQDAQDAKYMELFNQQAQLPPQPAYNPPPVPGQPNLQPGVQMPPNGQYGLLALQSAQAPRPTGL